MIYYTIFFITISSLFALSSIYRKPIFLWIAVFIAFLFSAIRYDAGHDFFNYLDLIQSDMGIQRLEVINRGIALLSKELSHPQLFFIITSFVYVFFMALSFRKFNNFNVVTLSSTFFFIGTYLTSFDIIRQMVAVAILFYALSCYINKQLIFSLIFFLLALGFHQSSFIYIGIIIYISVIKSRRFNIAIYAMAICASFFSTDLFIAISNHMGLYSSYFEGGGNDTGNNIYYMLLVYTASLLFFAKFTGIRKDRFWLYFNLYFLGIILYTALLPFGYFATRISYFLFPFGFLAWSELIKYSSKNKLYMHIYTYTFSSIIFFLMLFISSFSDRNPFLNYTFYFLT